ncbi:MAG: hypothetical protein GY737_19130 [Desulfobacteraceae bacterium]|nr:hypothetical protein [Desulfobacteraceae bacterium]
MPYLEANELVQGPITKGVGTLTAKNLAMDVALVQNLLNLVAKIPEADRKAYYDTKSSISPVPAGNAIPRPANTTRQPLRLLTVNGKCDGFTIERIKAFQGEFLSFQPDGNIGAGGKTWNKLVAVSQTQVNSTNKRKLVLGDNPVVHDMASVDKVRLKAMIKSHLYLDNKNEDCAGFIEYLLSDSSVKNIYWAAYYLATVYHETSYSFKPVWEAGKGKGKFYGKDVLVKDSYGYRGTKDKEYINVFYGRGFVQLTHGEAYKFISEKINLKKDELHINPDKALESDTAYKILTYWMQNDIPNVKGKGRKIQEYISITGCPDYKGARAIVNKGDYEERIANYAIVFEILLILSARQ